MSTSLVNWWAVLAATALNMAVGYLWYGPLFGSLWLRLVNKKPEELHGASEPVTYLIPMIGAFAGALVPAIVIPLLRVFTWWSGAAWGALLWFALGGTAVLTIGAFHGRNQAVSWLFIGYMVLVHAAAGAMFAVWR